MEKNEFQALFRKTMRTYGFQVSGNYAYKFIEDDYLVGVWLLHGSYGREYYIQYGVIYEPDEEQRKKPFRMKTDWHSRFKFASHPEDDLSKYPIENLKIAISREFITDCFHYPRWSETYFTQCVAVNMERLVTPLYDKEYVLDQYRNDWILFRCVHIDTARKIARLAGLDEKEVILVRNSRLTEWPDEINGIRFYRATYTVPSPDKRGD